jgi:uroporphyrinogen-III synthase
MKQLNGLRVLNTRPSEQGFHLRKAIEASGGTSLDCPALAIEELSFSLPELGHLSWAIFISANAVNYFFKKFWQQKPAWPSTIKVIAVGQATANALLKHAVHVDFIPTETNSESLIRLKALQKIEGQEILLVKGQAGRKLIAQTLRKRGSHLVILEVYKRLMPKVDKQYIDFLWQEEAVDIILFTSEQAMQNIFILFGESARRWLCKTPSLVLSQRLAQAAASLGIEEIIISKPETILDTLHYFSQGLIHGNQQ